MKLDELIDNCNGEIDDCMSYENVEKVLNSLQYKEYVKDLERREKQ